MPKLLLITERFHSGNRPTNNIWNLAGSWKCANLGEYSHYYIDPSAIWSTQQVDEVLDKEKYDLAFISVYHHLPSQQMLSRVGHKTVLCWFDGIVSMDGIRHWSQFCPQINLDHTMNHPNVFNLSIPQDETYFKPDDSIEKDIDISFIGSIDSHRPDRAILRDKLINAGFNVHFSGGRGDGNYDNHPIEKYVNLFQRTKINLNLGYAHGGRQQKKGRIFELASMKSFTFSNCERMLDGWFDENIDYVSFNDDNIIDKLSYYLNQSDERQAIAKNMHQKYMEKYSAKHFWGNILKICNVN